MNKKRKIREGIECLITIGEKLQYDSKRNEK